MSNQVLGYLDKFKAETQIRYGIPGQTLSFTFTPAYAETDAVPGATAREQVSHISQSDTLTETDDDYQRCGAASLINALLLLGGDFGAAANKLGLTGSNLTYANLHQAQEALFDFANTDGSGGLGSSYSYSYSGDTLRSVELRGEVTAALDKIGLQGEILLGSTVSGLHQRKPAVEAFWRSKPDGVLLVGIHLDTETGALSSPTASTRQNHFVTVFKQDGKYLLADTGASDNGAGNSLHELSQQQLEDFVYQTSAHVIGVSLKPGTARAPRH